MIPPGLLTEASSTSVFFALCETTADCWLIWIHVRKGTNAQTFSGVIGSSRSNPVRAVSRSGVRYTAILFTQIERRPWIPCPTLSELFETRMQERVDSRWLPRRTQESKERRWPPETSWCSLPWWIKCQLNSPTWSTLTTRDWRQNHAWGPQISHPRSSTPPSIMKSPSHSSSARTKRKCERRKDCTQQKRSWQWDTWKVIPH